MRGKPRIEIAGQRFGSLVAIAYTGRGDKNRTFWLCRCDCGRQVCVESFKLRTGHSKSCGCLRNVGHPRHGKSRTGIYNLWQSMMNRCYLPSVKNYFRYGGRGITVCQRWHKFENFYADMGDPPGRGRYLQIDRKDNDGPYSPDNCCWATPKQQAMNRRPRSCHSLRTRRDFLSLS